MTSVYNSALSHSKEGLTSTTTTTSTTSTTTVKNTKEGRKHNEKKKIIDSPSLALVTKEEEKMEESMQRKDNNNSSSNGNNSSNGNGNGNPTTADENTDRSEEHVQTRPHSLRKTAGLLTNKWRRSKANIFLSGGDLNNNSNENGNHHEEGGSLSDSNLQSKLTNEPGSRMSLSTGRETLRRLFKHNPDHSSSSSAVEATTSSATLNTTQSLENPEFVHNTDKILIAMQVALTTEITRRETIKEEIELYQIRAGYNTTQQMKRKTQLLDLYNTFDHCVPAKGSLSESSAFTHIKQQILDLIDQNDAPYSSKDNNSNNNNSNGIT